MLETLNTFRVVKINRNLILFGRSKKKNSYFKNVDF